MAGHLSSSAWLVNLKRTNESLVRTVNLWIRPTITESVGFFFEKKLLLNCYTIYDKQKQKLPQTKTSTTKPQEISDKQLCLVLSGKKSFRRTNLVTTEAVLSVFNYSEQLKLLKQPFFFRISSCSSRCKKDNSKLLQDIYKQC